MSSDEGEGVADGGAIESKAMAERIKKERGYLGLSQQDVATALGVSRAAVSALENGHRRVSGLELKKLSELFGVSGDRLLGQEPVRDTTVDALFRTTNALSDSGKEQLLRFAEFLREAGPAPRLDDNKPGGDEA
jgi:transcriptional regulator with XRE-family HTH domain